MPYFSSNKCIGVLANAWNSWKLDFPLFGCCSNLQRATLNYLFSVLVLFWLSLRCHSNAVKNLLPDRLPDATNKIHLSQFGEILFSFVKITSFFEILPLDLGVPVTSFVSFKFPDFSLIFSEMSKFPDFP